MTNLFSYSPSVHVFFPWASPVTFFSLSVPYIFGFFLTKWLLSIPLCTYLVPLGFPPFLFPFTAPSGPFVCSLCPSSHHHSYSAPLQFPAFTLFLGRRHWAGHKPPKDSQVCKIHRPLSAAPKAIDQLHILTYTQLSPLPPGWNKALSLLCKTKYCWRRLLNPA